MSSDSSHLNIGSGTPSPAGAGPVWRLALLLVLFGWSLQVYCIWSRRYVPLMDLPNHMARHYLESLKLAGRELPPFYEIEYRVMPNLGADLVIPLLMQIWSPLTAGKVFLTLCAFLYWLGPALFIWQQGCYQPQAVLASLLFLPLTFSSQFFWGFLNYYSGLGIAFLAITHQIRLNRAARPRVWELLLHCVLVTLLFLWHMAPWVIYGVITGCHLGVEAIQRISQKNGWQKLFQRALLLGLPSIPSLLLFYYYSMVHAAVDPAAGYQWGGWLRKLELPFAIFRTYDWPADAAVSILWIGIILATFGVDCFRKWQWSWLHLAVAVLALWYLVTPFQLGTTSDADSRILPAVLICLLAMFGAIPIQRWRIGIALLTVCLLIRFGSIAIAWNGLSRRLEDQAQAFAFLEPHDRVLPVVLLPEESKSYPEKHFVSWAVIERGVYVSNLFSHLDQHTLRIFPPTKEYGRILNTGYFINNEEVRKKFDYVWVFNPDGKIIQVPPKYEELFSQDSLTLWRVH